MVSFILILAMLLSLAACGSPKSASQKAPAATPTAAATAPIETPAEAPAPEEASEPAPEEELSPVVVTVTPMDHSVYDDSSNSSVALIYDLAQLSGGDPMAVDAINQFLYEKYTEYYEGIPALEVDYLLSFSIDASLFYTVECHQSYLDGEILSLFLGSDWMMGGVGNYIPYGYTFDLTTGKHLGLQDLFPSGDSTALLEQIKDCIRRYIQENNLYDADMNQEEIISGYTLDALAYYIAEDGELVICIPVYQLGPGAAGSFTIPTGIYLGGELPEETASPSSDVPAAEFIGQPVSALLDHYGTDYFQDNFSGSTYLRFDTSPTFFIGYCTEDIPSDALIRQILASSPCTLLDNIQTCATYPELVQMVGDAVTLEEPKHIFIEMEEIYEYTLNFDYQNYHFTYTWYDDPMASEADFVYLYRLDIPTVP